MNENRQGLDVGRVLGIVGARWKTVLAITLVAAMAAYAYVTFVAKPVYEAQALVTYQVPGYDIPSATYELQIPVKSNELNVPLPAVAQVGPLLQAYARDPVAAGTISGAMTRAEFASVCSSDSISACSIARRSPSSRARPTGWPSLSFSPISEIARSPTRPAIPPPPRLARK